MIYILQFHAKPMATSSSGFVIIWTRAISKFSALSLAFLIRKFNSVRVEKNQNYLRNLFSRPQKSFIVTDNQYANYKILTTTKRETTHRKADVKKKLVIYALS